MISDEEANILPDSKCLDCGHEFIGKNNAGYCPECGSPNRRITAHDKLFITLKESSHVRKLNTLVLQLSTIIAIISFFTIIFQIYENIYNFSIISSIILVLSIICAITSYKINKYLIRH